LDRTVTVGIISATARNRVGVATYENFIETDASINQGNSGGPLVNLDGKVIGINTAIVAAGQGIGFSIPTNKAKEVMRQLIAPGQPVRLKVIRERKPVTLSVTVTEMLAEEPVLAGAPDEESWGLGVEPLSGEAAAQLGLTIAGGLLVTDVATGGPADRAGLRRGDVIVEVGKKPVADPAALFRMLAQLKPGDRVLV